MRDLTLVMGLVHITGVMCIVNMKFYVYMGIKGLLSGKLVFVESPRADVYPGKSAPA